MEGYLTTTQTAERLKISQARVRQLILEGIVKADKFGRDNFISESEVQRLEATNRKPGRPAKKESAGK